MSENLYLSTLFTTQVWPSFSNTLKKEKTRSDYLYNVSSICKYLQCDFLDITPDKAKDYFSYICSNKEKTLSVKTVNTKLSNLRSVASHIEAHKMDFGIPGYMNPFTSVSVDSYDIYLSIEDLPSIETIDMLLEAAEDDDTMFLIISLALRCALTPTEICRLSPSKIALDTTNKGFITIRNYGKERLVRIPDDVMDILTHYVKAHYLETKEHLFYNQKGKVLQIRPLQKRMSELCEKAGLDKPVTLQDIRNTSIAYMLYGGATNDSVAEYTGISERWLFRFNRVIESIQNAPCEYMHLIIKK